MPLAKGVIESLKQLVDSGELPRSCAADVAAVVAEVEVLQARVERQSKMLDEYVDAAVDINERLRDLGLRYSIDGGAPDLTRDVLAALGQREPSTEGDMAPPSSSAGGSAPPAASPPATSPSPAEASPCAPSTTGEQRVRDACAKACAKEAAIGHLREVVDGVRGRLASHLATLADEDGMVLLPHDMRKLVDDCAHALSATSGFAAPTLNGVPIVTSALPAALGVDVVGVDFNLAGDRSVVVEVCDGCGKVSPGPDHTCNLAWPRAAKENPHIAPEYMERLRALPGVVDEPDVAADTFLRGQRVWGARERVRERDDG